jgi:hypothetical protein
MFATKQNLFESFWSHKMKITTSARTFPQILENENWLKWKNFLNEKVAQDIKEK